MTASARAFLRREATTRRTRPNHDAAPSGPPRPGDRRLSACNAAQSARSAGLYVRLRARLRPYHRRAIRGGSDVGRPVATRASTLSPSGQLEGDPLRSARSHGRSPPMARPAAGGRLRIDDSRVPGILGPMLAPEILNLYLGALRKAGLP